MGVRLPANSIPIPLNAVACELRCVVRQTEVHMSAIAHGIIDTVRNQHALGQGRKVVIERIYETGRKATDPMKEVIRSTVQFAERLPKWNYTITPQIKH